MLAKVSVSEARNSEIQLAGLREVVLCWRAGQLNRERWLERMSISMIARIFIPEMISNST